MAPRGVRRADSCFLLLKAFAVQSGISKVCCKVYASPMAMPKRAGIQAKQLHNSKKRC